MDDIDFSKIVWLKNVHCSNINLIDSQVGTKVIAVCSFAETDGLHGLMMSAVRNRWYSDQDVTFNMSQSSVNMLCKPTLYDRTDTVTVAYDRRDCTVGSRPIKRRLTPVMRTESVDSIVKKRMTCTARVDLAFVNVTIDIDKTSEPNTYTVSYDSFHTVCNPSLYARSNIELLE